VNLADRLIANRVGMQVGGLGPGPLLELHGPHRHKSVSFARPAVAGGAVDVESFAAAVHRLLADLNPLGEGRYPGGVVDRGGGSRSLGGGLGVRLGGGLLRRRRLIARRLVARCLVGRFGGAGLFSRWSLLGHFLFGGRWLVGWLPLGPLLDGWLL